MFKIRASQAYKIYSKKLKLEKTAKSYLIEWFAGDNEPIHSKYFAKGNTVEEECIQFCAEVLNLGFLAKNEETKEDEFFKGTADIVTSEYIIDVKSPWNQKTLHEHALDPMPWMYYLQLQIYMHLYERKKAILFYGLMDTPIEIGYHETNFESLPNEKRWFAYEIDFNPSIIKDLIDLVVESRKFLKEHEKGLKSVLGKLNTYGIQEKNTHLESIDNDPTSNNFISDLI